MSTIEQRLSAALSTETSAFLGREVSAHHDDREGDKSIYVHGVSVIAPLGDGRTFRVLARAFQSGGWVEVERALAAAHGRIRERYWPEEEQLSLRAATRFIAGRLELEEAAKAVRTSEADARLVLSDAVTKGVELGLRSAEKELTQRIHRRTS